jgi:predicted amidophosphoribosyltransferase
MGDVTHDSVTCSRCGHTLAPDHRGPCPRCGDHRKTHHLNVSETLYISGKVRWQHVHTFYEKHPLSLTLLILITLGSPILGLIFAGFVGVGIGLVVGIVGLLIGFRAVTKVREIHDSGE